MYNDFQFPPKIVGAEGEGRRIGIGEVGRSTMKNRVCPLIRTTGIILSVN